MQRVYSGGWQGAVLLVLPYIRLLRERWAAGSGSTRRSHLVTAPRKALTPAPIPGRAAFREGTRRDRGPPPAGRTAQQPPPSPVGREQPRTNPHRRRGGGGGGGGGGGRRAGCAWPQQPGGRQLTERRGARLPPREHAPATSDSFSVRGKACAPPPGFRARS